MSKKKKDDTMFVFEKGIKTGVWKRLEREYDVGADVSIVGQDVVLHSNDTYTRGTEHRTRRSEESQPDGL